MRMLLNYSTTIPLARTLAEIAKACPVPITFEHDHGRVSAVTFRYAGELYRLSPNVEGAWALLNQAKGLARAKRTYEHAERRRLALRALVGQGGACAGGDGHGGPEGSAGV